MQDPRPTTAAVVMAACALVFVSAMRSAPVCAATFKVVAADRLGEGFNDGTPRAPVGGNPKTTLGTQRLYVMQYAAGLWGAVLHSDVVIKFGIEFGPFAANECIPTSALLGSAGPATAFANFMGAPRRDTLYASALADSLAGTDLFPGGNDILAEFNQNIDSGCFASGAPNGWYYGVDNNPPPGTLNLLQVVLHEIAHGLGFASFVDDNGARCCGDFPMDDAFIVNLEWHELGLTWPLLTDEERVLSMYAVDGLHWIGSNVRAASSLLTTGRTGDHVQMFAPAVPQPGASVSHFSTVLTPNELLEPFLAAAPLRTLTLNALQDIGWVLENVNTPTATVSATNTAVPTATRTPTTSPTPTMTPSATPSATQTASPTQTWTPPPTATATPTATHTVKRRLLCECDCNDDGKVAINEVQGLARVYLGMQMLEYCPLADLNSDAAISIEELQLAVNLYLAGCP